MTDHPIPVRRNSFRRINDDEYLDITLGPVKTLTRENRNGADHIVTEFRNGTVIVSESAMRDWVRMVTALGVIPRVGQPALPDPDGDNT